MEMLFRSDIEPRCGYCAKGEALTGGDVICKKHGVVSEGSCCRAFRYDPQKRVPPRAPALKKAFSGEDFSIDF